MLCASGATLEGIAELRACCGGRCARGRSSAEALRRGASRGVQPGGPVAGASVARRHRASDTDLARLMQDMPPIEDLLDSRAHDAPVIRMINALLLQALRERASDIHFEPYEARSVGALPHRRRCCATS